MKRSQLFFLLIPILGTIAILAARNLASSTTKSTTNVPLIQVQQTSFSRTVQAEGVLKAETSTPINAPSGNAMLQIYWIEKNGTPVKKGDIVIKFDPSSFKQKLQDSEAEKKLVTSDLASERIRANRTKESKARQSSSAQKELEIAQSRSSSKQSDIFSKNEILGSEIDGQLSAAKVVHAIATDKIDRHISQKKMRLLDLKKKSSELAITRAQEGLDKVQVVAPHDGIFIHARPGLKAGKSIYTGWKLGELPLVSSMQAVVYVMESDIMGIEEGQSATMYVESTPNKPFTASIKKVAAQAESRQQDVPTQYFSLTLELKETDTEIMKPGSRIVASIQLPKIENVIVIPRQCVFDLDGDAVVYKKTKHTFEPVVIKLGAGTPGRVTVTEGLDPGDWIATQSPFAIQDNAKKKNTEENSKKEKESQT